MVLQVQSIAQVKNYKPILSTPQMAKIKKMLKNLSADQQAMARGLMGNAMEKL